MALPGPSVQHLGLAGRLQRGPGLPEGRLVQHLAIQGGHAPSFGLALLHCLDDPPGVLHVLGVGRVHLVSDADLAWVDGPLPDEPERSRPDALPAVALRVRDVRVRPVDGVEPVSPGRDDGPAADVVSDVTRVARPVIEVDALGGGVVREPDDQRLQSVARSLLTCFQRSLSRSVL